MRFLYFPTKKLLKSAKCAVANQYTYYGTKGDYAWRLESHYHPTQLRWFSPPLFRDSDLVWCEGPKGGVRLVAFNWRKYFNEFRKLGYITTNEKAMKEFAWIKLKAVVLS